ncbi:IucA/IucC family protein [Longispora fulva]|uniref:Siderophore synthetase component n=1 Tax=Longispora fulva TaxID=619741 RepID=A0A8J7GG24_9ACTN|nr:IucA/IucC family protein [Longispora fulva]MBG6135353.1 siderophore synthetase component [Longispora fulva]
MGAESGRDVVTVAPSTLPALLAAAAARAVPRLPADLVGGFRAALPQAAAHVCARLVEAVFTEDVAGSRGGLRALGDVWVWPARSGGVVTFPGVRGAASTVRVTGPVWHEAGCVRVPVTDPAALLALLVGVETGTLPAELVDAVVNLAIGTARRPAVAGTDAVSAAGRLGPDEGVLFLERLATEGHNLHPCGRTRLGMSVADVLAYDLEGPGFDLAVVALRADVHVGDDVGAALGLPAAPDGFVLQPAHPWQVANVLRTRHADAGRAGLWRVVDGLRVPCAPTASLRTVLTGAGQLVKVSLDVQITSTRRSISVATARNGPPVSALVETLLAGTGGSLLGEFAGAGALLAASERDVTAVLRHPLAGVVSAGELAVPANALPAVCPATGSTVLELLAAAHPHGPVAWLSDYATALLGPVLRLLAHGVGLEAHLQNCVPLFTAGRCARMVFRDLGGVRLHGPRLAAAGHPLTLWPGSVTGTDDADVLRAKVAYTALGNHLGAVVDGLGLGAVGWATVGRVLRGVYAPLLDDALVGVAAAEDLGALTAGPWAHKALVRMRLSGGGDEYVPVDNPLAA